MVSVIITTYGANEKLLRAVDSVLEQTYQELEVIVVDDNNPETDQRARTEKMMLKYANDRRVKYIKHSKNKNGSAARNTGVKFSKGEYIAFLDDDDYYLPKRIERALLVMNQNEKLDGVCCEVVKIQGKYITQVMQVEEGHIMTIEDLLIYPTSIGSGSNIFLKKEIIDAVNGFDEEFARKQDIEFMLRIIEIGTISYTHDIQIVKDVSGVRKINYNNNKEALILFDKKFKAQMQKMSVDNFNKFYESQYEFLFTVAKRSGNRKIIEEAIVNLINVEPEKKYLLKYILPILIESKVYNFADSSILNPLLMLIKKWRYKKFDIRLRHLIADDTYSLIMQKAY